MIGRSILGLVRTGGFSSKRFLSLSSFRSQEVRNHAPDKLERKFLVWTGKYKTVNDVPSHITCDEMERCRNRIRIRLANIMMGLTIVGCILMILSGKAAAKRGESVSQQNLDWHKQYNASTAKKEE